MLSFQPKVGPENCPILVIEILAIGDIHGKDVWRQFIKIGDPDVIVFIGDYIIIDNWIMNSEQRRNLKDIVGFKRANFSKVHLILGNHDTPFVYHDFHVAQIASPRMHKLYRDNFDCFDVAYQNDSYLFSHAGVTKQWFQKHRIAIESSKGDSLGERLNSIHHSTDHHMLLERGKARGGSFDVGGVIYADKSETEIDPLTGYNQVVGHTKVKQPTVISSHRGTMIYLDCLNTVSSCVLVDSPKIAVLDSRGRVTDRKSIPIPAPIQA